MKKFITVLATCILLSATVVHAHSLFFTLLDNEDGTIELEGMYSTGEIASHTLVKVFNGENHALIWEGKTDDFGTCTFKRPSLPYEVELDAGPGHVAKEDGI